MSKHHHRGRGRTQSKPADKPLSVNREIPRTPPNLPAWKKAVFALVMVVSLPLMTEGVLWFAGIETLLQREDPFRGFSGLVSVFERHGDVYRTARIDGPKTFNEQSFAVTKPSNGLRIFCLGGSSSYGFPWGGEAAFTAILGDSLKAARPDLAVEAVNASGVSYAMHRLRILANELVRYEPDIFIIYSGHNEFVERGYFKALASQSVERNQIQYALGHSRTYTVLRALVHRDDEKQSEAQRFETFVRRDESQTYDAGEKSEIVESFRTQLLSLVAHAKAHNVRVLLATVPCNLADWKPNKSTIAEALSADQQRAWATHFRDGKSDVSNGRFAEGLKRLEQARGLAPSHAETDFLMGKALAEFDRIEEARAAFDRACDHDASPIRRISAINEVIRDVAREQNLLLVDVEKNFMALSPGGLLGFNLIEDYVHPTKEGHQIIAWLLLSAMSEAGWLDRPLSLTREQFDGIASRRKVGPEHNATWHFNQGYMLQHQGRIEEAIRKYADALAASPMHAQALGNMAPLLFSTGRLAEAEDAFRKLFEIDPGNAGGRIAYAAILAGMNRYSEAAEQYRLVIDRAPERLEAYVGLARCLAGMDLKREAESACLQALKAAPAHVDALVTYGGILEETGRLPEAMLQFRKAVKSNPDSVLAHCALAGAAWSAGDKAEAGRLIETAELLVQDQAAEHFDLGTALVKIQRYGDAIEHLKVVLNANPQHVKANERVALAMWRLNRVEDAVAYLSRIADLQPNSASAQQNLGTGFLELGRFKEAAERFRASLRIRDDLAKSHAGLAFALMRLGQSEDARNHMQRAVQLEPQNAEYRSRLEALNKDAP